MQVVQIWLQKQNCFSHIGKDTYKSLGKHGLILNPSLKTMQVDSTIPSLHDWVELGLRVKAESGMAPEGGAFFINAASWRLCSYDLVPDSEPRDARQLFLRPNISE